MRRLVFWFRAALISALLFVIPVIARCDEVTLTVPQSELGIPFYAPGHILLSSSDLNGTVLSGQTLSLDFVLANDVLARLTVNDAYYSVGLILQTNASTYPGFAGLSTGYFLGPSGNQLGPTLGGGSADSSNGGLAIFLDFSAADLGGDTSGFHFDITLPDSGYVVTNTGLNYAFDSSLDDGIEFGTAQQLPEPSSITLALIGAGLVAVIARRRRLTLLDRF